MSTRMSLALAAMLLAAGAAHAAEPAEEEAPAPTFAAPTEATVAALWEDFLARGTSASVGALAPLTDVLDEDGDVDADLCREHRAKLEHATAVAPVSLGAWYFAQACAQAIGDEAWAATALDAFAALSRHALLASGANEWNAPIRVVAVIDIDAFVLASGERLLYRYIDLNSLPRWMVYRVALRESETSVLRRYRFDYLDTVMRLTHEPGWDAPVARRRVVDKWVHTPDADAEVAAAGAAWDAAVQSDAAKRMAGLHELAREGNLFATFAYTTTCLGRDVPCARDAVDLLLPLAEIRMPEAMVQLAVANATGIGTKTDEKAARALLEAAASRMPPGDAEGMFALSWTQRKGAGELPAWARKAAYEAARAGNGTAVVGYALATAKREKLRRDAIDLLESDYREHRSAPAAFLLAMHIAASEPGSKRFGELLEAAAEGGYHPAYAPLAALLEHDSNGTTGQAHRWRLEAARAGDVESMRKIGDWSGAGNPPPDPAGARIWYANAAAQGDTVAALALAKMVAVGSPGMESDFSAAAGILKELSDRGDAEGRRLYAMLLMGGQGVDKDAVAAEKILREGDAAGDADATALLGNSLAFGDGSAERVAEGLELLAKAAKAGNGAAMNSLAIARYWGIGGGVDLAAGRDWWERAIAAGDDTAYNDYAWHLCTSAHESFVDGRRGLETMDALDERRDLDWANVDTIAACHAAAGDFERAVETQQRAIDAARTAGAEAATLANLDGRLARYRAHEREVVRSLTGGAPPAPPADAPPADHGGSP